MDTPALPEAVQSQPPADPAPGRQGAVSTGPAAGGGPWIWSVAGGKGGVGRTLLAANLGIQLARSGQRVILVDLDLQSSNLHAYLGFPRLPRSLGDFAAGGTGPLADLALDTAIGNLRLIGGIQTGVGCDNPAGLVESVTRQFDALPADIVLVDCGSGRSPATLLAFARGALGLLVTTAEPAALESVCLFTEAHLRACLGRALSDARRAEIEQSLSREGLDAGRAPFRLLMSRLAACDPAARDAIAEAVRRTRLELLLNQVRGEPDEEAAAALVSGFRKCFGLQVPIAGLVEHDPAVLQSVRKRRPLAQQHPNTSATREIARAARGLLATASDAAGGGEAEWEDLEGIDHYRVLEIVPKASSKEVQSAYRALKRAYDPETTCLAPLLDTQALRDTLARIEASYRTLIFLESRVAYDRHLLESGARRADDLRGLHLERAAAADEPRPAAPGPDAPGAPLELAGSGPAPAIARPAQSDGEGRAAAPAAAAERPATESGGQVTDAPAEIPATGAGLRDARTRRGQSLEEISRRSKIRAAYLTAIEEERFASLPAAVYLRGFIKEYATCLGLPGDEVSHRYMKRYRDWQQAQVPSPGRDGD